MAWSREQKRNAQIIIEVGEQLGASRRDIVIALMTAMQESTLRALDYGHLDSIGLFQQRNAWGTRAQRLDPRSSARMFFLGGHGGQRGLFDFENRDRMTLTEAAQAVQVSAYPGAYAKWRDEAVNLLGVSAGAIIGLDLGSGALGGKGGKGESKLVTDEMRVEAGLEPLEIPGVSDDPRYAPAVQQTGSATPGAEAYAAPMSREDIASFSRMEELPKFARSGGFRGLDLDADDENAKRWRRRVARIARRYLGTPYVWGGENPSGFDCSGFVQYVYRKLGVDLPRVSFQQAEAGKRIGLDGLKAGDLVAWNNSSRNPGADHIAIYLGNGRIIEAPRPGGVVQISELYDTDNAWGVRMRI